MLSCSPVFASHRISRFSINPADETSKSTFCARERRRRRRGELHVNAPFTSRFSMCDYARNDEAHRARVRDRRNRYIDHSPHSVHSRESSSFLVFFSLFFSSLFFFPEPLTHRLRRITAASVRMRARARPRYFRELRDVGEKNLRRESPSRNPPTCALGLILPRMRHKKMRRLAFLPRRLRGRRGHT